MTAPVPKLGNMPSRFRLIATPVLSVMIASSVSAMLPIIAQSPILPPFGLLVLLAWRLLHAELWPLWIGAPLGAFDDIMSGHPLGTAMFTWSMVMIAIEFVDQRIMWRDYWHDWLIVGIAVAFTIISGLIIANISGSRTNPILILPQICWSAMIYPLIVLGIARLDRWRIMA